MGQIRILVQGSFQDNDDISFTAQTHGHADAVEQALKYLDSLHEKAVQQDLKLASKGEKPSAGFGVTITEEMKTW